MKSLTETSLCPLFFLAKATRQNVLPCLVFNRPGATVVVGVAGAAGVEAVDVVFLLVCVGCGVSLLANVEEDEEADKSFFLPFLFSLFGSTQRPIPPSWRRTALLTVGGRTWEGEAGTVLCRVQDASCKTSASPCFCELLSGVSRKGLLLLETEEAENGWEL